MSDRQIPQYTAALGSGPTGHHEVRRHQLHDLTVLIAGRATHGHDATLRARSRWPDSKDFALDMQGIAGPGRLRPLDFAAGTDHPAGQSRTGGDEKPHGHSGRMPAARREAAKETVLRRCFRKMEGLWVELRGESLYLCRVHDMAGSGELLAHLQILQIKRRPVIFVGRWFLCVFHAL
jgi:hypothetical protein